MRLIARWKPEQESAYEMPSAIMWEDDTPATMDDYRAHELDTHSLHGMRHVPTSAGMTLISDNVLLGELCDGLLKQIANDPEKYRDQYNPPNRVTRIK